MRRLGSIELAAIAAELVGLERAAVLGEEPAATRFRAAVDAQHGEELAEAVAGLLQQLLADPPLPEVVGRLAVLAAAQLAALNGDHLDLEPPEDAARFVADVAAGEVEPDKVLAWVSARLARPTDPYPDQMEGPMFERFTPRAKTALTRAEAAARSLQHNYVGTEHLLVGILNDEASVGARALVKLGIEGSAVRDEILRRVGEGPNPPGDRLPFTPRCKHAMEHALREALQLGHNYIGTEHLVLGLMRQHDGIAAQVLADAGITRDDLQREVVALLTAHTPPGGTQAAPTGDPERIHVEISAGEGWEASWRKRKEAGTSGPACIRCDAPFPDRLGAQQARIGGLAGGVQIVHCRSCGATVTVLPDDSGRRRR